MPLYQESSLARSSCKAPQAWAERESPVSDKPGGGQVPSPLSNSEEECPSPAPTRTAEQAGRAAKIQKGPSLPGLEEVKEVTEVTQGHDMRWWRRTPRATFSVGS